MATAGPNNPGTLADDAGVGTTVWADPSNAASSNDIYAVNSVALSGTSHYLKATNFGFSIPAGSTINGITVEIERKASGLATITDSRVRLVKGGTIQTTDKASGSNWPESDTYASYGGAADLWGDTWTADDINNSGFGAVLAATSSSGGDASVDHMRITIDYTAPTLGSLTGGLTKGLMQKLLV